MHCQNITWDRANIMPGGHVLVVAFETSPCARLAVASAANEDLPIAVGFQSAATTALNPSRARVEAGVESVACERTLSSAVEEVAAVLDEAVPWWALPRGEREISSALHNVLVEQTLVHVQCIG
jgi:hypothetical protein